MKFRTIALLAFIFLLSLMVSSAALAQSNNQNQANEQKKEDSRRKDYVVRLFEVKQVIRSTRGVIHGAGR